MADALPNGIGVSALQRYDMATVRTTSDKFADTASLHASLLSGEVADGYKQVGLTPERFNQAFHATMETIASESQADNGST